MMMHIPSRDRRTARHGERGVVLMWVGFFLLIILAFISLGIDLAKLAGTRTQLQNAADAASLAGASAVDFSTGVIDADSAVTRAQTAGASNKAYIDTPQPVVIAAGDVVVTDGDKVTVTARREGGTSIVTYFAQVLGITALEMKADATAKVEPAGGVECGLVPIAVAPPDGQTEFHTGCNPGYILKVGGGSGNIGNYGPIDFPACSTPGPCAGMSETGANTFKCLVANGYCCGVSIGDVLATEPGNMAGPMKMGIKARFDADTDSRQGICYDDYHGNDQRIIFVPVTTDPGPGKSSVTVLGFAAFFIKNIPGAGANSTLEGEFVYYVVPGTGGGNPTGAVAYALRLIE